MCSSFVLLGFEVIKTGLEVLKFQDAMLINDYVAGHSCYWCIDSIQIADLILTDLVHRTILVHIADKFLCDSVKKLTRALFSMKHVSKGYDETEWGREVSR